MQIYNTNFEISMRILLLLNSFDEPLDLDKIKSIDILSTYGKQYGISNSNLHGNSTYTVSEISTRRELINNALKELVIQEQVKFIATSSGFSYTITDVGKKICSQMASDYSKEYSEAVLLTKNFIENKTEKEIRTLIYKTFLRRD